MVPMGMGKKIEFTRPHLGGDTASTMAVAPFVRIKLAAAQSTEADPPAIPSRQDVTSKTFGLLRQIEAGDLSIGYVDTGPADGRVAILLHGWPYDIHSLPTSRHSWPRRAGA